MTRLWVLVVVASCLALTVATSMNDGYYADEEPYPDVRQPRDYYPHHSRDSGNYYPGDQPSDQLGDQNDLQLEFNGNLKVYGNGVSRGPFGQAGKLYDTLTGYNDGDSGYYGRDRGYDGRDGGYGGSQDGYWDSEGGY